MMLNTKLQLPMTFVLQNYHIRFVEPGQDSDPVHIGSKDDVRLNVCHSSCQEVIKLNTVIDLKSDQMF